MPDDLTRSVEKVAEALRLLGNADAATPMGAIEGLGAVFKEGFERVADAIKEGFERVADAVEGHEDHADDAHELAPFRLA